MTYDEARAIIAEHLERHASAAGSPQDGYDGVDVALPRDRGPAWAKVYTALSFWDSWIDAWNHQWRYYEPIREQDWPVLAREIARRLREDREIEDPVIVKRFAPKPRGPLRARVKQFLTGAK